MKRFMRLEIGLVLAGAVAVAQSSTTTFIENINGRNDEATSLQSSDHTKTERWQSINGRRIPLEQVEERVIRDSGGVKVTERIVKKFNPTGEQISAEKTVSEERKTAGASAVQETVWRSDVNGSLQEAERRNTETRGSGANSSSETTVARPTINGTFQNVERRSAVTTGTEAKQQTEQTVYRLSQNGGMSEALRQVTLSTKQGNRNTADTAYYEPGVTGALELARRSVTSTVKKPDGSEATQVDLYARSAYGIVQAPGAPQQMREQQIIEKRKNADGSVDETLSVRRPTVADPTQLGAIQKISETVCAGKCD